MKNTIFMMFFIVGVFTLFGDDEADDYKAWLRSQREVVESEKVDDSGMDNNDSDTVNNDDYVNDSDSYDQDIPDKDSFEDNYSVKDDPEKIAEKEQKSEKEVYYVIKRHLTPVPCIPRAEMENVAVIPVTDVLFRLGKKRRLWCPAGAHSGLKKGQKLHVCRDVGEKHLYPVAEVEITEIWDNDLMAEPLEMFKSEVNEGPGIRKGDVVVFGKHIESRKFETEKEKLVEEDAKQTEKDRKKDVPAVCPAPVRSEPMREFGYDRVVYPDFSGELLRFQVEKDAPEKKDEKTENKD